MSSQLQYVYIPNLVGRQVLRVPVLPCEDTTVEESVESSSSLSSAQLNMDLNMKTNTDARATSPVPSIESVNEEE